MLCLCEIVGQTRTESCLRREGHVGNRGQEKAAALCSEVALGDAIARSAEPVWQENRWKTRDIQGMEKDSSRCTVFAAQRRRKRNLMNLLNTEERDNAKSMTSKMTPDLNTGRK